MTREEILRRWTWKPVKVVYCPWGDDKRTTSTGYIIATLGNNPHYPSKCQEWPCIVDKDSWSHMGPGDRGYVISIEDYPQCDTTLEEAIAYVKYQGHIKLLERPTCSRNHNYSIQLILD